MPLRYTIDELLYKNIHPLIDSRKLLPVSQAVFFALKGEHRDGHDFISEVYKGGIRNFVISVEKEAIAYDFPDATFYSVPNVLEALQKWALHHRSKFGYPVIGITGSNGKTIVKEWLFTLLEADYQVVKSPKSYNSQIGVPLSIAMMSASHSLGIFEAGISKVGEMQRLYEIIRPTIGILTNIGTAHDEGFLNKQQKLEEKCRLFQSCQTLIYPADDELIAAYLEQFRQKHPFLRLVGWGKKNNAVVRYELRTRQANQVEAKIEYMQKKFSLLLPFSDKASVENTLTCLTTLLVLGYEPEKITLKIPLLARKQTTQLHMRLELKKGIHNCLLIDDSYNNDLAGLNVALDFLAQQDDIRPRTVILSEMLETRSFLPQIVQLLQSRKISKLIGVGSEFLVHRNMFENKFQTYFYTDTDVLLKAIQQKELILSNEIILIKGARKYAFERVVALLEQKVHGTRLEINLDALVHNLNFYRSLLEPHTKMMVMVKALGYGSGAMEIARLLQYHLVDYLGVAYTDEGVALRENGIHLPIMVMNPASETFEKLLEYRLEPEVYSFRQLAAFTEFLVEKNLSSYPIHLNIDTGMARLGFTPKEVAQLIDVIKQYGQYVRIASIYSHLAAADEAKYASFTEKQIADFQSVARQITEEIALPQGYRPLWHILNSAGITRYPKAQFDMVRLGIGLHGIEVNQLYQSSLRVVSTLKTNISQIKYLAKGKTVGYGCRGIALHENTKIGTIAIGYADGFSRAFSRGVGKVWINGKLAPVIGNVCMDMTMIDLTDIPAEEGDEVIIFGEQLPIQHLAEAIHTIPYEILTSVSERVKRVFYSE